MAEPEASEQPSDSQTSSATEPLWVTVAWILIPLVVGLLVAASLWI